MGPVIFRFEGIAKKFKFVKSPISGGNVPARLLKGTRITLT
jgi:hypothetical protein